MAVATTFNIHSIDIMLISLQSVEDCLIYKIAKISVLFLQEQYEFTSVTSVYGY